MCTTAVKRVSDSWFLLKTRDPVSWMRWDDDIKLFNEKEDKFKKLIIQNPNPNEDGFYGGINEKGVAIVATFVRVSENQISYLKKPYIRLILEAANAKEAVEIIKAFNPRIGGNIFIADSEKCFGIEAVPDEYFIEEINLPSVKTNHFHKIKIDDLEMKQSDEFRQWSEDHYERASELIAKAENLEDFKDLLRDRKNSDKKSAICTTSDEEECFTYSAFIFDTKNKKVFYSKGNPLENEFMEYGF